MPLFFVPFSTSDVIIRKNKKTETHLTSSILNYWGKAAEFRLNMKRFPEII